MDNDLREVMKDVPDLYVGPARSAGCGLREGTAPPTSWWINKGRSATMSSSPLERLDLLLRILDAVDGPQGAFGESRSGEDVDCRSRVIAEASKPSIRRSFVDRAHEIFGRHITPPSDFQQNRDLTQTACSLWTSISVISKQFAE